MHNGNYCAVYLNTSHVFQLHTLSKAIQNKIECSLTSQFYLLNKVETFISCIVQVIIWFLLDLSFTSLHIGIVLRILHKHTTLPASILFMSFSLVRFSSSLRHDAIPIHQYKVRLLDIERGARPSAPRDAPPTAPSFVMQNMGSLRFFFGVISSYCNQIYINCSPSVAGGFSKTGTLAILPSVQRILLQIETFLNDQCN